VSTAEVTNETKARLVSGVVIRKKADKTAVVEKSYLKKHNKYKKYVKKSTRYYVHDENNELKEGNSVMIRFVKPISKTKCWVVEKVLS